MEERPGDASKQARSGQAATAATTTTEKRVKKQKKKKERRNADERTKLRRRNQKNPSAQQHFYSHLIAIVRIYSARFLSSCAPDCSLSLSPCAYNNLYI